MGFKTELDLRLRPDGLWQHLDDLVWVGSEGDRVTVPAGRTTDFASVPRLLQNVLPSADPRVVRAAVVHDFLCRELNDYRRAVRAWLDGPRDSVSPTEPVFSSTDADAIFKKIMRDEGAGWWMQNIGWLGVRLGAAVSAARRPGSLSTLPGVAGLSLLFLCLTLGLLALVCWVVPW